jgi:hypothetical protein
VCDVSACEGMHYLVCVMSVHALIACEISTLPCVLALRAVPLQSTLTVLIRAAHSPHRSILPQLAEGDTKKEHEPHRRQERGVGIGAGYFVRPVCWQGRG